MSRAAERARRSPGCPVVGTSATTALFCTRRKGIPLHARAWHHAKASMADLLPAMPSAEDSDRAGAPHMDIFGVYHPGAGHGLHGAPRVVEV